MKTVLFMFFIILSYQLVPAGTKLGTRHRTSRSTGTILSTILRGRFWYETPGGRGEIQKGTQGMCLGKRVSARWTGIMKRMKKETGKGETVKMQDLIKKVCNPHCGLCSGTGYVKGSVWTSPGGLVRLYDSDTVCECVPEIVMTIDGVTIGGAPYSDTDLE